MNLKPFTGPGSTPSRRRFWDKVTQVVIASQKVPGRFVTTDEHPGKGTVINVADSSTRRGGGGGGGVGACCYDDGTCDDLTESDCNDAEGNWQGPGTTCADDPNPCLGACCEGEGGTTCVPDSTPDSCADDGGTFQDFGSTCDPNPCIVTGACCPPDGSGCSTLSEEDCAGIGGRFLGGSCDDVICSVCRDEFAEPCTCVGFNPFINPDNALCYSHVETDCDGMVTYSSEVPCDSRFTSGTSTNTCCDPCTGSGFNCTSIFFCDYTDPDFPVCNAFISSGCLEPTDCTSDPPNGCTTSNVQDVFGLASPPVCGG